MLADPLIDWLQMYGKEPGVHTKARNWPIITRTWISWSLFSTRGREFEVGILRLFREEYEVATVAQCYQDISKP